MYESSSESSSSDEEQALLILSLLEDAESSDEEALLLLALLKNRQMKQSGVNLASKQELQSDELIPETSFQQPEGYLPEHTPSSSQTEETTNRPPEKKYYSSKVYCRMCLESIVAKAQMVPLTLMDINFPAKNAAFKQKKEMETYRITNMIQVVMPDFDFNAAYNPIVCIKCITRLESAYNFIKGCQENEKLIHLYKSKYCPNLELVSCEDVAKNKSLLMDQPSTRKRRKTSNRHINTEAVSESLVEQSVGQLEERSNTELASDTSQVGHYEMVFASSSGYQDNLAPETSVELPSSIKCETEDYDGYGDDSHILINPEEVSSIVKEEIVVKEEVSGNFTDTSNNERVDQLEMDYHVKEEKDEDCLQPDSGMSHIDDYHKNSPQYPPTNQMSLTFNRPKT